MRHLSNIGLKNFRVFKDLTEFSFAPITVLTGTNNSGKSSLLKALLLLKDNWERYENLDFSGSQHLLGNYTSTVYENKNENNITFQLPFSLPAIGNNLYLELVYELNKSNELKNGILKEYNIIDRTTNEKVISIGNNLYSQEVWLNIDFFILGIKNYQNYVQRFQSKSKIKVERKFELEGKKKRTKTEEEELQKLLIDPNVMERHIDDVPNNQKKIFFDTSPNYAIWPKTFLAPDGWFVETEYQVGKPILHYPYFYADEIYSIFNLTDNKINGIIDLWNGILEQNRNKTNYSLSDELKSRGIQKKEFEAVIYVSDEYIIINKLREKYNISSTEELISRFISDEIPFLQMRINNPTANDILETGVDIKEALNLFLPQILKTGYYGRFDLNFKMEKNIVFDYFKLRYDSVSDPSFIHQSKLEIKRDNYNLIVTYFDKGLKLAEKEIKQFLNGFSTLQTIRSLTHREFSLQNPSQSFEGLLHSYHGFSVNIKKSRLKFVNKWLKKFGIKESIRIELSEEGKLSKILLGERNLADYGFGMSQLIPILLKIYTMSIRGFDYDSYQRGYYSGTLYIEEPETNLHPRLQSLLADVFYEAAQVFHIQFIIETHSEYLIRKLQYLTAKKKIKPDDSVIYYFNDPDKIPKGEKQVKEIRIREDGMMDDDFGDGFFDESTRLTIDLLKLQNKN